MTRVGVLTVSDRASSGEYEDRSGPAISAVLTELDDVVVERALVIADDRPTIEATLTEWASELDVILTTGGTGLGPRDVTPDATMAVADRSVPGIAELLRRSGATQHPHAVLSRQVAVQRGRCLIVNLPGSPGGAAEGAQLLAPLMAHAVATMQGGGHH